MLIGASLLAVSRAIQAQNDAATITQSSGPSDAPADSGLTEITITAQRKEESLQRAAVAVAVVSNTALLEKGVTSPGQLTELVPAINVQPAGGAASTFFVRGVGNFAVNGYTDPAIAFNYDGVYVGRVTSTQSLMYDLERVELLKGPQGTLYGRNATSGALNLIPARPVLGETSGFVSASYGNFDALLAQGAANVALGDHSAVRVSALRSKHDGYLSDGTSDEDLSAVRVQMLTDPTDGLRMRIGADYAPSGGAGTGSSYVGGYRYNAATGTYVTTPSGLGPEVGLFDPAAQAYRSSQFSGLAGRVLAPLDRKSFLDNDNYGVNAEVNVDSPVGTFTILPAWRAADLNEIFAVPAFEAYLQEKDEQFSLETRLNGQANTWLDYIVGAYYFDERVKGNYTFNQQALSVFQDFTSKTRSLAAFGRLTAHVTDRFRVVGGLRYTDDDKHFDGTAEPVQVVCSRRVNGVPSCPTAPLIPTVDNASQVGFAVPAVGGAPVPIGTSGAIATASLTAVDTPLSANKLTYRAATEFDVAPASLLYASYETGYRSGGFSLASGHETFQPEYLDAYTLGLKNRFFANRLQLNLEAFVWKFRDQQVTHAGIDSHGLQGNFTENVGRSTNRGFELETQFLALQDLLVSADAQYLDASYDSFVYQVPVGNAPPFVGCPYAVNASNPAFYTVNCSGKTAYQSPRWTVNLGIQQTFHLGSMQLVAQADTQYKTSRVVAFEYLPYQIVGPNWQSNAQLSLSPDSSKWTVAGYVQNIEDHRNEVGAPIYGVGGLTTMVTTAPRTYGMRISARF